MEGISCFDGSSIAYLPFDCLSFSSICLLFLVDRIVEYTVFLSNSDLWDDLISRISLLIHLGDLAGVAAPVQYKMDE